jgi:hypothetical protein
VVSVDLRATLATKDQRDLLEMKAAQVHRVNVV